MRRFPSSDSPGSSGALVQLQFWRKAMPKRLRIVADSASILLEHLYYFRHPTRQPAGTRV